MSIQDWEAVRELRKERDALAARLADMQAGAALLSRQSEAYEALLAEAETLINSMARAIEGYKRAGWITNVYEAEHATDLVARAKRLAVSATVDCDHCHKTFAGPGFCCERPDCPHAANRVIGSAPAAPTLPLAGVWQCDCGQNNRPERVRCANCDQPITTVTVTGAP
jgi:hypothetical protein